MPDPIQLDLVAMKACHAATTPGEWLNLEPRHCERDGDSLDIIIRRLKRCTDNWTATDADKRFIAKSHQWLPQLIEEVERLQRENKILTHRCQGTLANNLCPDHRDKQIGKPCLACEIERLEKTKRTTYIVSESTYDDEISTD